MTFTALEVDADGRVERQDGVARFAEIVLRAKVSVSAGTTRQRATGDPREKQQGVSSVPVARHADPPGSRDQGRIKQSWTVPAATDVESTAPMNTASCQTGTVSGAVLDQHDPQNVVGEPAAHLQGSREARDKPSLCTLQRGISQHQVNRHSKGGWP